MSRIRTIKPELWTSEQVSSCSLQARLLFIGMWNFCDDNGVHHASCKRLKMEVFPGDNFTEKNISDWIKELIQNRLVMEYEKEGKSYWIVTGWKKHQRIERPTYRYPLPKTELENIDDPSVSAQRIFPDNSYKTQQIPQDLLPPEWNGMERIGKEKI
ncbi:hypothetical protein ACTAZI_15600 [Legionella bozemanae]|uniref:hypothetical protein n=1 Tax=Legionella bozemanae TaxID=447 RepID=UPI003EEAC002